MAVVSTVSNHFKYLLATKAVDMANDTFKIILMNTTFAFNKDTHAELADVTANQIATGFGYTQNDKTLAGVSVTEDDSNDRCGITWNNVVWTASGGDIPASGAAIIYDDTVSGDPVVGCIDFGADYEVLDTLALSIKSIALYVS